MPGICLVILIIIFMQINYRIEYSEEIFDDPSAVALLEVYYLCFSELFSENPMTLLPYHFMHY